MLNEDLMRKSLRTVWGVEALGIPFEKKKEIVMKTFEKKMHVNGSSYITKLPFKEEYGSVPDNYSLSVGRLHSLQKKLMANPKDYSNIIEDYKAQSIVQEVTDLGPRGRTHCLPHQGVLREEHDTTKARVVFDKLEGPILNERLNQGPCLLPLLFPAFKSIKLHLSMIFANLSSD